MSWGRLDDGFTNHPKILALGSKARRWTWLEILGYSWRYRSPIVPSGIGEIIRDATPKYLDDCEVIGLLDRDTQGRHTIHDWPLYSDVSITEKVAYYLDRNPQATSNEVARSVGGTRNLVLDEVRRYRNNGTETVRPNQQNGTNPGTHAPAPLPSRTEPVLKGSSVCETTPKTSSYDARANEEKPGHEAITTPYFALLHAACGSSDDALMKLTRAARGKPEATIVVAFEAATGPGVNDPLAVALSQLKKGVTPAA